MRTALLDELLCNEKLLCLFCLFYFSSFSAFIVTWIWLPDFNTVLAMFPNVCGVIAFITASKPLCSINTVGCIIRENAQPVAILFQCIRMIFKNRFFRSCYIFVWLSLSVHRSIILLQVSLLWLFSLDL